VLKPLKFVLACLIGISLALPAPAKGGNHELRLKLVGALCPACLKQLRKELSELKGVRKSAVSGVQRKNGKKFATAIIDYDATKLTPEDIKNFLARHDFDAVVVPNPHL